MPIIEMMRQTESDRNLNTVEGLTKFISDLNQLEEKGFDMTVVKDAAQKALDLKRDPTDFERQVEREDARKLAKLRKDLADEQGKTDTNRTSE